MRNLARHLFDYQRPETRGEVVYFKVFETFVAYATIALAWTWGSYTQRITDIVQPLGIAQYLDVSFMVGNGLTLVNAGLVTGLVLAGFFRVWKGAYLGAFLLLHLQFVARFSLGKIPHSSNLLGLTLLGLALAALLFHEPYFRRRFTLGFTYFFAGLGYTLAAWSKLIGTGPGWADGRHLWMWVHEKSTDMYAKTGVMDLNFLQEWVLAAPLLATAFLTVGLLTELFSFLLWWKPFRMPVLLALLGLHVGIWLVMNILFAFSIAEVVLLALPWAAGLDRLLKKEAAAAALLRPVEMLATRYG